MTKAEQLISDKIRTYYRKKRKMSVKSARPHGVDWRVVFAENRGPHGLTVVWLGQRAIEQILEGRKHE